MAGLKNLHIAALPQEPLDLLADNLSRTLDWGLMLTDGVLYVSDADIQVELPLEWLMGER